MISFIDAESGLQVRIIVGVRPDMKRFLSLLTRCIPTVNP